MHFYLKKYLHIIINSEEIETVWRRLKGSIRFHFIKGGMKTDFNYFPWGIFI